MSVNELLTNFYIKWHSTFCENFKTKLRVSDETAEDLAHKAYEWAIKYSNTYREGNFVTYMMGIADNVIRSYYKNGNYGKSRSKQYRIINWNEEDLPELVEHPKAYDDSYKAVNILFKKLPNNKQRTLLWTYYTQSFDAPCPVADMARFLQKNNNSVKSNFFASLEKCRRILAEQGYTKESFFT